MQKSLWMSRQGQALRSRSKPVAVLNRRADVVHPHAHRKALRPVFRIIHARRLHPSYHGQPLFHAQWPGSQPCFAPDFAFLLLVAGSLVGLAYLLAVMRGVSVVNPYSLVGHPISLASPGL